MRRGLLLDFDGTLVDSLPPLRDAYSNFLHSYGLEPSPAEFEEMNGLQLTQIVRRLRDRYRLNASLAELMNHYQGLLEDQESRLAIRDGARDLLDIAASKGYARAIVTSSSRCRVERFLRRSGLDSDVDLIVGSELPAKRKPHPDPYLTAIRELSTDPKKSIAVEDSLLGATAATAAGIPVVFIGPGKAPSSVSLVASVESLTDVIPFLDPRP